MITVQITVAGAGQFTDTLITDFLGEGALPDDTNIQIRLIGFFYNSLGATHTQRLYWTPTAGAAVNLQGDIFNNTTGTAGNSFMSACGKDGIVVPRLNAASSPPYLMRLTTVGKTGDGTLTCWYTKDIIR